jgi:hypothetical protein
MGHGAMGPLLALGKKFTWKKKPNFLKNKIKKKLINFHQFFWRLEKFSHFSFFSVIFSGKKSHMCENNTGNCKKKFKKALNKWKCPSTTWSFWKQIMQLNYCKPTISNLPPPPHPCCTHTQRSLIWSRNHLLLVGGKNMNCRTLRGCREEGNILYIFMHVYVYIPTYKHIANVTDLLTHTSSWRCQSRSRSRSQSGTIERSRSRSKSQRSTPFEVSNRSIA